MGSRGGSRAVATSKMERCVIRVNGFQPLTIITKCPILAAAAALDLPLGPGQEIVDMFLEMTKSIRDFKETEIGEMISWHVCLN